GDQVMAPDFSYSILTIDGSGVKSITNSAVTANRVNIVSAATLNVDGALTVTPYNVNGAVIIDGGLVFTDASGKAATGTLMITGTLNAAYFTAGSGTVIYYGKADQLVTDFGATQGYYNLVLRGGNKSIALFDADGKSTLGNLYVTNDLYLENGVVATTGTVYGKNVYFRNF
ncbi:MAG: hypothetical protein RRY34_05775, partial [Victivallaceae bacterium]